jgi:hypothetical protein
MELSVCYASWLRVCHASCPFLCSGETAAGAYPLKSLEVLRGVATRIEAWIRWA